MIDKLCLGTPSVVVVAIVSHIFFAADTKIRKEFAIDREVVVVVVVVVVVDDVVTRKS